MLLSLLHGPVRLLIKLGSKFRILKRVVLASFKQGGAENKTGGPRRPPKP